MPLHLVGGSVRDLLLGSPSPDLDLCVEGDGAAFARELAAALGATVTEQRRFLTAKVEAADGAIDVATARGESYPRPGALPHVTPGGIEDDLARRDFTVNAMALRLDTARRRWLDPFGGRDDLARRRLRVLHEGSFVDDPTRVLRAARYAARLGFRLERRTAGLAAEAVRAGCIDTVSGERIRRELMLLLEEPGAAAGVALCARAGALEALHPGLRVGPATGRDLRRAGVLCARFSPGEAGKNVSCGLVRLLVLADRLSAAQGRALSARLRLTARQARALAAYLTARTRARRVLSAPKVRNSVIARVLDGLPAEAVVALAATSNVRVRRHCVHFLVCLRDMKSRVSGEDLLAAGFTPGPAWSKALAAARDARLDGRAKSKEDELRIAAAALHSARRSE